MVAPQSTTHSSVYRVEPTTTYPLWVHLITSTVKVWNIQKIYYVSSKIKCSTFFYLWLISLLHFYLCYKELPNMPTLSVGDTTPTTISLSWTTGVSFVDSYEVIWKRDISGECPDVDEGSATITDESTSYTIARLEEGSNYNITVTAINAAGSAVSVPVTAMTGEAGEGLQLY